MKTDFLKILFLLAAKLLVFISCSSEDILIDRYSNDASFLFQTSDGIIKKISTVDDSVFEINLQNFNIGKIDVMKKFRGKFYFISSETQKIFVITEKTFEENTFEIEEVDYSHLDLVPIDICFPNATDGYVAHSNDSCVTILDLTNNKISGVRIPTSGFAGRIAGIGNQVHLTIPNKNLVEIIDTRTNKVEYTLSVSGKPTFIEFVDDGTKSVVVSIGDGKDNSTQAMTPAKIFVIDAYDPKIIMETNIGGNNEISIIPTSIAVSQRFIYISSTNNSSSSSTVWRISTSNFRATTSMSRNNSSFVGYSRKYDIVYLLETSDRSQNQMTLYTGTNSRIKTIPFTELPTVIIDE